MELVPCRGEMRIRLRERGSCQLDVGPRNAALDGVFPPGARDSEHLLHDPCALILGEPVPFGSIDDALKVRAIVGFIEVQHMIRLFDVWVHIESRRQAPASRRQEEPVVPQMIVAVADRDIEGDPAVELLEIALDTVLRS